VGFGSGTYTSVPGVHKKLSLNYFIPKLDFVFALNV